jgi:hypothetical protein
MDKLWKLRDKRLMLLYERFMEAAEGCDIFYNSVGVNFHPEFIKNMTIFTIYGCNDDPEASERKSKYTAFSYDMCAVGNIAEIDTYLSWGCKSVEWQPMGIGDLMYDPNLTYERILNEERDIDLFMMIDRLAYSGKRNKRFDLLEAAFPNGYFYGRGWKRGYLPQGEEVNYLCRSKIGINMHLSTGPINRRLYYLPANGVLQICDNKSNLAKIYELGKEVIGFDSIEECIEKCHYYLDHYDEARWIAAEGYKRVHRDYNEIAVFIYLLNNIRKYYSEKKDIEKLQSSRIVLQKNKCQLISDLYFLYMRLKVKVNKLLYLLWNYLQLHFGIF